MSDDERLAQILLKISPDYRSYGDAGDDFRELHEDMEYMVQLVAKIRGEVQAIRRTLGLATRYVEQLEAEIVRLRDRNTELTQELALARSAAEEHHP